MTPARQGEFEIVVTKTCEVEGVDNKPALSLTLTGTKLKIELLPKQGQRRSPVHIETLRKALNALDGQRAIGPGS